MAPSAEGEMAFWRQRLVVLGPSPLPDAHQGTVVELASPFGTFLDKREIVNIVLTTL